MTQTQIKRNARRALKTTCFTFRILLESGREERTSFSAETEEEAREQAELWAGDTAIVSECCDRWSVDV